MASPYFFEENPPLEGDFTVSEETSRHVSQVLRMKEGEEMIITNGKGYTLKCTIVLADKKKTKVRITEKIFHELPQPFVAIAVSLIKNNNRFEFFAEKATEIGVSKIIPLLCKRTEKTHFKKERIKSILISAMLQSQQSWLPEIEDPKKFNDLIKIGGYQQKFIAHCTEDKKTELKNVANEITSKIILIGPEGDFTNEEIEEALQQNFIPVSLGNTRLRTETAAVVAAVLLK
ncbi:MAG TPA: RsmE family RNA methyltransferase [Hanamia sp.]|jgi:16S rRNA (uracil1498-N3)-methyltransferase|nr:RsmE family RNA methyltransferase [Hanamia sp.]